ncbi:GNAT family N-acetyltransferase [Streptomyces sp. NBC_01565]|uniref:GNAT family N-acetyltransferase n=1 Tax=unclassified Streptomyces TaxID=2593676 RepID=UPI0022557EA6|nr:GNAT family N-acetyltransferase [Streptomyces sp. NBC_01565]MCX4539609.1 GNAT family N-acetyltransferase [Streptomyces sp. NBC_01565]
MNPGPGPHDLDAAVALSVRALREVAGLDWSAPAAGLEWSCRDTAVHLAGDLTGFAAQLAGRVSDSYLPFLVGVAPGTPPGGLIDLVEAGGRLLRAAVYAAGSGDRAWHPAGWAGADGFAAMGVTEILLHTHDILRGLGTPDRAVSPYLAARVLDRLFPHTPRGAGGDPWDRLLWATGRADLPDLPRPRVWRWYNEPVRARGVTLCEISPALAADLHAGGTGGFAWADDGPAEGTRFAAGTVAKAREEGTYRPGWGAYAIVRDSDRRAVGGIGFHAAPDGGGHAEIGYDLVPSARGAGHATEALRALCAWAFAQPGVTGLHAEVEEGNAPSHAVLRRAGFRPAGHGEGGARYALTPAGLRAGTP